MAAPAFVNVGAHANGTSAVTPALPASLSTDDILILWVEKSEEPNAATISNQNGGVWTLIGSQVSTAAASMLTVFWSRFNGTQGNPTVADPGNHLNCRIIAYRGCPTSGNPWDNTAFSADTLPPGITTLGADRLVLGLVCDDWDNNSTARYTFTNADLTGVTERADAGSISGDGGGLGAAEGVRAAAATVAAWGGSFNASITGGASCTIALKPAATTIAVGQVTETDLAQAVAWAPKNRLVGQITETDLSQTITSAKARLLGQITEADIAQAITIAKSLLVGQITETDLAQVITSAKVLLLGQSFETDLAQPVTVGAAGPIIVILGQATEADLAQAISAAKRLLLGQATETDLAQSVLWSPKTRIVGQAFETDFAQAVTFVPAGGVAIVTFIPTFRTRRGR